MALRGIQLLYCSSVDSITTPVLGSRMHACVQLQQNSMTSAGPIHMTWIAYMLELHAGIVITMNAIKISECEGCHEMTEGASNAVCTAHVCRSCSYMMSQIIAAPCIQLNFFFYL